MSYSPMAIFLFVQRIAQKANQALSASAGNTHDCDMPDAAEPNTIQPSSDAGSKPENSSYETFVSGAGPMDAVAFREMMVQQYLERYSELTHSHRLPTDTERETSPSAKKRKREDEQVGSPPTQDHDEHESKKIKTNSSVHSKHLMRARTALKVLEFTHARARKKKPRKINVVKSHEHKGTQTEQSKIPQPQLGIGSMALPYRPSGKVR